jgi:3-deoxy-D-manno-octulosonate 8-phosphate phosphatase (KDO 8-P phosphatase)
MTERTTEPTPAEALAALAPALRDLFARAEALVLDVDGVLTDGGIESRSDGTEALTFHVRDSSGTWQAHKAGIRVGIVTGRATGIPESKTALFPLSGVRAGRLDKGEALRSLLAEWNVAPERCAYVADDVLDGPALRLVGLPICVADAEPDVLRLARYVTRRRGGRGAVREVTDLLLEARGARAALVERLLGTPRVADGVR